MELGKSVSSYRLHNQGFPNKITYNTQLPPPKDSIIKRLKDIGHVVTSKMGGSVAQTVAKQQDGISAMSDPRKYAEADGY